MPLAHVLEVNALTLEGPHGPTLSATWSWAPALLTQAAVDELAQGWFATLEALARHAGRPGIGGRTPSDLPLLTLSQAQIEQLESRYRRIDDVLPLTPLQEGLLFHALYDARAPDVYTVQLVVGLQGALAGEALASAARGLLERHASLRAGFWHEGLDHPVQVIVADAPLCWRSLDLSLAEPGEREQRLAEVLAQERAQRFELSAPPLLRFALIRLGSEEHRLVVTNHHIVLDGWSLPVLVEELLTLYRERERASLPAVTPYRDYLGWLARQDRAMAMAAWNEALAGLEEPTLVAPAGRTRAPRVPEQIALPLSETLSGALQQAARRHGVTLNTVLEAAWAMLLGRMSGRDDVVFGVTVAGRSPELAGIERMVGLFINTLPLRVRLPARLPLSALLRAVQDSQSRLMTHQHVGLAEIQRLTGLGDLFDTLVVFENYPVDRGALMAAADGLRITGISGRDATHYPLGLVAVPGERLRLRLDYRPDLFERGSVEALAGRLVRLLEGTVAAPDRPIGSLDILGAEEREAILRGWNDSAQAIAPATLPQLFAAQAQKAPDAVAVVCGEQRLSYGELERRANQLAHHLRALGVGPEVVVGLCAKRSLEMVVGLLAILKAGGAYLPLDPGYPAERLAFMLADAQAQVLVTQAALADRLPAQGMTVLRLDADWPAIARHSARAPAVALDPHNAAYVIYTSGSTGTPKGVVVDHPACRQIASLAQIAGVRLAAIAPRWSISIAFDASIQQTLGAAVRGAGGGVAIRDCRRGMRRTALGQSDARVTRT